MQPLRNAVPRILAKHLRKVLNSAGPALRTGRDEDLHALRIAVKRLRYNLEFFRLILGPSVGEALDIVEKMQERLGTISDSDRFAENYAALRRRLPRRDPRRAGLRALKLAAATARERSLVALRSAWIRDDGRGYPDRLTRSISDALGSLSPNPDA